MDIRQKSLEKHYEWNGKIEVVSRVPISNAEDLSLASVSYTHLTLPTT